MHLSFAQIQQFKIDGYLVCAMSLSPGELKELRGLAKDHSQQRIEPFELEAAVQYPGAPSSEKAEGGETIRRLQMAYQRDLALRKVAELTMITQGIQHILGAEQLWLNPNHHNCIMDPNNLNLALKPCGIGTPAIGISTISI